ncbi:DUF7218 family protein [Streptomyces sparsogenes]|uniref:DUF7218 family protein n=1 Tax=Streptomyces sparsogenes TaxID=67365 RepID=UPI003F4D6523
MEIIGHRHDSEMNHLRSRDRGRTVEGSRRESSMVSDRGGRWGFVYRSRQAAYRALRRQGASKSKAARIANAGRYWVQRSRMSRKAARTRSRRGK